MREENDRLRWQSKAILLLVVPWTAISVVLQSYWWAMHAPVVTWTTLGISGVFALLVWKMRAGTAAAAATGGLITASLMFSTTRFPYEWSWVHGGLMPLLAVFLLTYAATKVGRAKKERLGTGESKRGRNAAQVAANLGAASLVSLLSVSSHFNTNYFANLVAIAALAEAAADTVSSEVGQVFGGTPRLLTTFRCVPAGTDGGMTLAGTFAGLFAAAIVILIGSWTIFEKWAYSHAWSWEITLSVFIGAGLGLQFDSLLGALFERRGWLNNDAVNFLSTISSVVFLLLALALFKALSVL